MSRSASASPPAAAFERVLDKTLRAALGHAPAGLGELLGELSGADPTVVLGALAPLAEIPDARGETARRLLAEAVKPRPQQAGVPPLAHPMDYAWMFTPETDESLLELLRRSSAPGELIVHLGTPSLHGLAAAELTDREHVLVDRDPRRVAGVRRSGRGCAVRHDLLAGPPAIVGAAVAVADPPWYPQHAAAFVWAAARCLRPGGLLLLACPSALTRPGIAAENQRLIDTAVSCGLGPGRREPGALRYLTPPFEQAAMAAAGVHGVPGDWRRADLWRLRSRGAGAAPELKPERVVWARHELEEIPLGVRADAPALGGELIASLVTGDVLASVSARVPERDTAALWTSRNRVFSSCDPPRLAQLLSRLAGGLPAEPEDRDAERRLHAIVALERDEHMLA